MQGSVSRTAVGYTRVSTEEQARSGLSLQAQKQAIEQAARDRGWQLEHVYVEQASGADKTRPVLAQARQRIRELDGEGALIVAKLDRLTRSLAHLADLLDVSREEGWSLVALDTGIDTSTDTGRMVAGIMGTIAEWERNRMRERIREAMQAKIATGWKPRTRPSVSENAARRIRELKNEGHTLAAISSALTREGYETARGGTWRPGTVARVLRRATAPAS